MLRGLVLGFFIGPILIVAALLLFSKSGLALLIVLGVLFGALLVAVVAGAATGRAAQRRRHGTGPSRD